MPSIRRIFSDLQVFRRQYLRNRIGLFFALIFPVILIILFGLIFSGGSSPVNVYYQNHDSGTLSSAYLTALNATGFVQLIPVNPSVNFSQYLLQNSYSEGLVIPSNFTSNLENRVPVNVTIYSNPASTSSDTVIGAVSLVTNSFNLKATGALPIVGISTQNVKSNSYKYIDFLVPGLIGFSILTSPMFSMVTIAAEYKKTKIFKQLSLTPLTKGEWLTSKIIWYIILTFASFVLMVLFGVELLGAQVQLSLWIVPFLIIGPLFFVALGMLVGTVTKSIESAGVIGNIITFPMMFLSGTFFPVSSMPQYLQNVARVLPLYYIIDGLNSVMIYDNFHQALTDLLIVAVLSAIVFALAVRLFKWRES